MQRSKRYHPQKPNIRDNNRLRYEDAILFSNVDGTKTQDALENKELTELGTFNPDDFPPPVGSWIRVKNWDPKGSNEWPHFCWMQRGTNPTRGEKSNDTIRELHYHTIRDSMRQDFVLYRLNSLPKGQKHNVVIKVGRTSIVREDFIRTRKGEDSNRGVDENVEGSNQKREDDHREIPRMTKRSKGGVQTANTENDPLLMPTEELCVTSPRESRSPSPPVDPGRGFFGTEERKNKEPFQPLPQQYPVTTPQFGLSVNITHNNSPMPWATQTINQDCYPIQTTTTSWQRSNFRNGDEVKSPVHELVTHPPPSINPQYEQQTGIMQTNPAMHREEKETGTIYNPATTRMTHASINGPGDENKDADINGPTGGIFMIIGPNGVYRSPDVPGITIFFGAAENILYLRQEKRDDTGVDVQWPPLLDGKQGVNVGNLQSSSIPDDTGNSLPGYEPLGVREEEEEEEENDTGSSTCSSFLTQTQEAVLFEILCYIVAAVGSALIFWQDVYVEPSGFKAVMLAQNLESFSLLLTSFRFRFLSFACFLVAQFGFLFESGRLGFQLVSSIFGTMAYGLFVWSMYKVPAGKPGRRFRIAGVVLVCAHLIVLIMTASDLFKSEVLGKYDFTTNLFAYMISIPSVVFCVMSIKTRCEYEWNSHDVRRRNAFKLAAKLPILLLSVFFIYVQNIVWLLICQQIGKSDDMEQKIDAVTTFLESAVLTIIVIMRNDYRTDIQQSGWRSKWEAEKTFAVHFLFTLLPTFFLIEFFYVVKTFDISKFS